MVTVGIDEVGRGCWAGPLVAGAVVLKHSFSGLRDSKQLSKLQRIKLAEAIKLSSAAMALGWVTAEEIDQNGLTAGIRLAYKRALELLQLAPDEIIIDGNYNFLAEEPRARAIVRADSLIPAVSAASIIAKVARDEYMRQIAADYPEYGFEKHVGYGTSAHLSALRTFGICRLHRPSFSPVRNVMELR
jgi:ribonuclease HII